MMNEEHLNVPSENKANPDTKTVSTEETLVILAMEARLLLSSLMEGASTTLRSLSTKFLLS